MKLITIIGIMLMIAGTLALAYGGFTYISRETVVDVGPVKVQADRERYVFLPPIVGGTALIVGAALTIAGLNQKTG